MRRERLRWLTAAAVAALSASLGAVQAAGESVPEAWDGYLLGTPVGNYPLQVRVTGGCPRGEATSQAWPPTAFSDVVLCEGRFEARMKAFFGELELLGEVHGDEASGAWRSPEESSSGRFRAWRRPSLQQEAGRDAYRAAVDRLVDLMTPLYPFWSRKGLKPAELRSRWRGAVDRVKTRDEFLSQMGRLVAGLHDAHTQIASAPALQRLVKGRTSGVLVDSVDGRYFVTEALPSIADLGAGPLEILSVDGVAVATHARRLLREVPLASGTPQHLKHLVCVYLLAGPPGTPALLKVRRGKGGSTTLTVPRGGERLPAVEGRLLANDVGYIRIRRLDQGEGTREAFEEALSRLRDAPALVLDLRNNGGGTSVLAVDIFGRLIGSPQVFATGAYPAADGFGPALSLPAGPVGPWQYTRPLVVLTNGGTYSTAEVLAASLKDAGRALLVGAPTGGGAGNKIGVILPGGVSAWFSTVDGRRADGRPFEGVGVAPDVAVTIKADALLSAPDPVLEAGLREARKRAGGPAAAE